MGELECQQLFYLQLPHCGLTAKLFNGKTFLLFLNEQLDHVGGERRSQFVVFLNNLNFKSWLRQLWWHQIVLFGGECVISVITHERVCVCVCADACAHSSLTLSWTLDYVLVPCVFLAKKSQLKIQHKHNCHNFVKFLNICICLSYRSIVAETDCIAW